MLASQDPFRHAMASYPLKKGPSPPPPSDPEACSRKHHDPRFTGFPFWERRRSWFWDMRPFPTRSNSTFVVKKRHAVLDQIAFKSAPPSCAMITADVRTVDEFNHNCLYTPYKPPADPNQCYRTTKVDEVEITACLTSAQSSRPHFKKYFSQVSGKRYQQDLHWAHPETGKVVKLH